MPALPPVMVVRAGLTSSTLDLKGSSPSSRAAPNGEAPAKASRVVGGGATRSGTGAASGVSTTRRGSTIGVRRISSRPPARRETLAVWSTPLARSTPCAISPLRAWTRAANRLEPATPLGRRRWSPITSRQDRLAASRRPSGAARAAGSLKASMKPSAWSTSLPDTAEPRIATSPRIATPATPSSSSRPARVTGPAFSAGATAKPAAATKNNAAPASHGSKRRRGAPVEALS